MYSFSFLVCVLLTWIHIFQVTASPPPIVIYVPEPYDEVDIVFGNAPTLPGNAIIASSSASSTSGSTISPDANLTSLYPSINWNHNLTDLGNLAPQSATLLYYSEIAGYHDPAISSQFVEANTNFTYPSVILEHSGFIQSVNCAGVPNAAGVTQLSIIFTTQESFIFAQQSWSTFQQFAVVTFTSGCGVSIDDTRSFWLANGLSYFSNSLTITINGTEIEIEDGIIDLDITWGTYTPSNSTQGSNNTNPATQGPSNSTCGTPPSSTINGLFTAPCGNGFDLALDNALGYLDFSAPNFASSLALFAPGVADTSGGAYNTRDLQKRSFGSFFTKAFKAVKSAVTSAAKVVASAVVTAAKTIAKTATTIANLITYSPSLEKVITFNAAPPKLVDSPFGKAAQLYKYQKSSSSGTASGSITMYCVGCGVNGNIDIKGSATISLAHGLTAGQISMSGFLHAGLALGLDAQAQYKQSFKTNIFSQGLPGFSVPKIITIGPVVSLSAELDLLLQAEGQLLVGVALDIPNFNAKLDLLDSSKSSSSGFTPQITRQFSAKGQITATATFMLPLSIGVGIVAPIIKFDKTISLTDRPGLTATATYSGSTTGTGIGGITTCLNGISYSISLFNDLLLDFFGLKTINLVGYHPPPLVGGCYLFGDNPTISPSKSGAGTVTVTKTTPTSILRTIATTVSNLLVSTSVTVTTVLTTVTLPGTTITALTTITLTASSTPQAVTTSSIPPTLVTTFSTSIISSSTTTSPDSTSSSTSSLPTTSSSPPEFEGLPRRQAAATSDAFDPDSPNVADQSDTTGTIEYQDSTGSAEFDLDPNDASYQAIQSQASNLAQTYSTTNPVVLNDGLSYVSIVDPSKAYELLASDDGNFYFASVSSGSDGSLFQSNDSIIAADANDRIFHYYTDTMQLFGVSRFRLSSETSIPTKSQVVALTPLNDGSVNTDDLIGFDANGNVLFPVLCNYQDQMSKLFIVSDLVNGPIKLTDPDLIYTVTGGVVTDCSYFPIVMTAAITASTA